MAIFEWSCPITGEILRAKVSGQEAFRAHLSAAGREFIGGWEAEARYWELREKGLSHADALNKVAKQKA